MSSHRPSSEWNDQSSLKGDLRSRLSSIDLNAAETKILTARIKGNDDDTAASELVTEGSVQQQRNTCENTITDDHRVSNEQVILLQYN
jgi:hypothetical protein